MGFPYLGKLPEFTALEGWFSVFRSAAWFPGFGSQLGLSRFMKFKLKQVFLQSLPQHNFHTTKVAVLQAVVGGGGVASPVGSC